MPIKILILVFLYFPNKILCNKGKDKIFYESIFDSPMFIRGNRYLRKILN